MLILSTSWRRIIPSELSYHQKKKFFSKVKHYYWEDLVLYIHYADQLIKRCIMEKEIEAILGHYHNMEYGGHFRGNKTAAKVLQSELY